LQGHQYITAGGGGAFLHLTHNLPQKLTSIYGEKDIHQQQIFPDRNKRRLLLEIFFHLKIPCLLFVLMYLSFLFLDYPGKREDLYNPVKPFSFVYNAIPMTLFYYTYNWFRSGLLFFTDTNVLSKAAKRVGIVTPPRSNFTNFSYVLPEWFF
jgi:hypothetical protein